MKSKFIFIIAVILVNTYSMKAQGVLFDKQYLYAVQSDDYIVQDAGYVFDGIYNNTTQNGVTNSGALWMQINTKCIRKISTIKLYTTSTNYYVFLSKSPFYHRNIEALIRDPWVTYFNITGGDGGGPGFSRTIPVGNINTQYIMILSTNVVNGSTQHFHINEIDIYGNYADCGPHFPPQNPPIVGPPVKPPYGTCGPWFWPTNNPPPVLPPYIIGPPFTGPDIIGVWPWWSSQEICGDGIDNDDNGLTDCEDYPCGVGTFNVVQTNPTCPICQNGKICIYANNNVRQVSIDNGATWSAFPNSGFYCFDNLNDGKYVVKLRTIYGCEDGKVITLNSPNGLSENCANGSFESGTFNGWQGGLLASVYPSFGDFTLVSNPPISDRMQIVGASYVDPNVPFISIPSFAARLGDFTSGAESEMLRYCFIASPNNSDFTFDYAVVLQDPMGHPSGYLEYRLVDNTTGQELIPPTRTVVTDPLLTPISGPGNWFAFGWQCESYNLSSVLGNEICLEVIVSNCSQTGHGAYAYIDGLCDSPSPPVVNIQANNVTCQTQKIQASILGNGFNAFQWEISKINKSGVEFDKVILPRTGGFQSSIDDLVKMYEENSNFTLPCPQRIKLKFIGFADCSGPGTDEMIIELVCGEDLNIDYCNPLYYCIGSNQNQLQIQGVNNCNDCTYEWSSPQGLGGMINTTSKFPILDRSLNSIAFNKEYNVVVTTPEGCEYNDTFTAEDFELDITVAPIIISYCDYSISGTVLLSADIPNSSIMCTAINTIDGSKVNLNITGTGLIRNFSTIISRETLTKYKIEVDIINGYFCKVGTCVKYVNLDLVPVSPYFKSWKAAWPNIFCNNQDLLGIQCDDLNSRFNLTFNTLQSNNCSVMSNPQQSSIYYYNLKIYDRWGNLVFEGTVSKLPTDTNGILGNESAVTWDGLFDGEEPESGVYTWVAEIKSCYNGNNNCNDCGGPVGFQYCSNGNYNNDGFEIIAGDVTLIN